MEIPTQMAVMTLPSVTLFPQALLPLYVFETRYRKMLAHTLENERMLVVAMQRPERVREAPSVVAGLGLVRIAVKNGDGTSHLILQGLCRVKLGAVVQRKPFRVHEIEPISVPTPDTVTVDSLLAKVRDLAVERIQLGWTFSGGAKNKGKKGKQPSMLSAKDVITCIREMNDADQVADLVSCALLPSPVERQAILETVEVAPRLKQLIHFLMAEIQEHRKNQAHE